MRYRLDRGWGLALFPFSGWPWVALMLLLASGPAFAAEPAPQTLILIRHGHYVPDPTADVRLGPGLSAVGVAQAQLTGHRLAAIAGQIDRWNVSPLQRARDTAAVIADAVPARFQVIDDLAECTPPTRRQDIMAAESPEALAACQAQLDRLFDTYFKPAAGRAQQQVLVCHGNVIRYLVTRALGVDSKAWLEMSVGHSSLTKIRVEADGSFKVIAVGDVGHLPLALASGASGDAEPSLAVPASAK